MERKKYEEVLHGFKLTLRPKYEIGKTIPDLAHMQ